MELPFIYIQTPLALASFAKEWKKHKVLAIDLECENNLHHYGVYLSTIQLSTPEIKDAKGNVTKTAQNFIIDTLALKTKKDRQPITNIFKDPKIEVIFHDYSFDFRIIGSELGITPQNLFDTQLAAQFLNNEKISLGDLIKKYCNVSLEKGFQKADWTKRPLPEGMLKYAAQDTAYLIELKEKLEAQLKKVQKTIPITKYKAFKEECENITSQTWKNPELSFENLKGVKALSSKEAAIAFELYTLRNTFAKDLDKPAHFVISNKFLKDLAQRPPKGISSWKRLRLHPKVKANANLWDKAIQTGKTKEYVIPVQERKRFSIEQKKLLEKLELVKEKAAKKAKVPSFLLASKSQLIAYTASKQDTKAQKEIFRPWQQELMFN